MYTFWFNKIPIGNNVKNYYGVGDNEIEKNKK